MNKKSKKNTEIYNGDVKKSIYYILLLASIGIILFLILYYLTKYKICYKKIVINQYFFNLFYIIFFGFLSTFLIFFGYKYLLYILKLFFTDIDLSYLIITTSMIIISLIYSAFLKGILECLFDKKMVIDEWQNIIGYPIGRIIGILVLFFIITQLKLK